MGEALPAAVLIDDDLLIHMAWKISATAMAREVRCYRTADEFFSEQERFSRDTPIYVDRNLGEGADGEQISRTICGLGFTHVYLATAYPPELFEPMPWLKGIVGKDPPWLSPVDFGTAD